MQKYIFFLVTCFVFGTCLSMVVRNPPLCVAVSENNIEEVKRLISKGVSLDENNSQGKTPLMIAAEYGNFDMVNLLLNSGAKIDFANCAWGTALSVAALYNQLEIVQVLLDRGAKINLGGAHTPLMQASQKGHIYK